MEGVTVGRSASEVPMLDHAEMRSWQNFLEAALRMSAMLNRSLVESHNLTLVDVRLLDMLKKSPAVTRGRGADGRSGRGADVAAEPGHQADPTARGARPGAPAGQRRRWPRSGGDDHRPGPAGREPRHDDLRAEREDTLPGPVVAPTGGGPGGELPPDQRWTEAGRAADPAGPGIRGLGR